MSTVDEIRKSRIKKLKAIVDAGFLAYPGRTKRSCALKNALDNFEDLSRQKKELFLTGRIVSLRQHGGIVFSHIEDGSGKIQICFKKDGLGERGYDFFLRNFDIGDFIEARGFLFITKRGEKTMDVSGYKMLSKSLLPLPEKWHGIQDAEERFRKRYLDLIFNPEIRDKFLIRSTVIKEIRAFLEKNGFLGVETPILQPIYGGANARPFKTHLNALDVDLYLRISPELYLKRLLVGGFEKVYEIGKCFRNEGADKFHNPDFTMLEFYWAYQDYKGLMTFTEKMLSALLKSIFKKTEMEYQGKKISFKFPLPRIEFNEIFKKYTKIDYEEINEKALKKEAKKLGLEPVGGKFETADEIYKKICKPKIWDPVFIIHYPAEAFSLAKTLDDNPQKSASFQLVAAGMEIVKAFSELNDPVLQKKRFELQEKIFKKGFDEAQRMDNEFITALEYGMPPAAGLGMGIDRLALLLTDSHAVREIILFPTMKPKER